MSDYYCVALSQTKCYNAGLDQCDFCKWKVKEDQEMLNEDQIYIGNKGLTLGDLLDRIMRGHLRDPNPVGPTKAMKRRNKLYNKAYNKAIEDVLDMLANRVKDGTMRYNNYCDYAIDIGGMRKK